LDVGFLLGLAKVLKVFG